MNGFLPPRPLMLDPKAVAKERRHLFFLSALFVVAGGGFVSGAGYFAKKTLHHLHVWENGRIGEITDLSGEVRSSGKFGLTIFHDYDLEISFLDDAGEAHSGKLEFSLFWSEADQSVDPKLRYLPASPEIFTLSPAVGSGPVAIWGATTMMAVLAALMLVALAGSVRQSKKRAHLLGLVMEDGEEVLAELLNVTKVQGNFIVKYRVPEDSSPRSESLNSAPLVVLEGDQAKVVLLRSPREPNSYLVMREDLTPILVDEAWRNSVRLKAAGSPAGH